MAELQAPSDHHITMMAPLSGGFGIFMMTSPLTGNTTVAKRATDGVPGKDGFDLLIYIEETTGQRSGRLTSTCHD